MNNFKDIALVEIKCDEILNLRFYPSELQPATDDEIYMTFNRLINTRDKWNKLDNFVADWDDAEDIKWCVIRENNNLCVYNLSSTYSPFYFMTAETAKLFLETFREEIELVKELIG